MRQLNSYLEGFTQLAEERAADFPLWLRELREGAFARFCAVGFPTTHDEDWRFTNLAGMARTPFQLPRGGIGRIEASRLAAWRMEAAARLVFVDGTFAPELSDLDGLPEGVIAESLRTQAASGAPEIADQFGRYVDIERDPFCALNTAFANDGAYVRVRHGTVIAQPIHLLYVATSQNTPVMTHPRNLLVVEDEAQASFVEDYVSMHDESPTPALSNSVTELVAGSNATVAHTMIVREHAQTYNLSTLRVELERNANVISHSLLLSGRLVRNNVHTVFSGEGGECLINGLFIGGDHQHLDNYMLVEHASPHCSSRQFYNGILDERARGVFHGRIIVHKDAQNTDAKQTNRNLLLSDDAQINTKPQLEIYADNVKCTHGATIGQIEEDALFYLRSRGLSEVDARNLLLRAFAGEFLERMKAGTARDYAELCISERLEKLAQVSRIESRGTEAEHALNWEEVG